MTSSWPLLEKARARSSPQPQQGSRFGAGVAELSVSMNLDVSEASTGGVDTMGDCSCLGDLEGVADDDDYGGGGGSGCVDADTGAGAGEMKRDTVGRLLALPEAILSEVLGYLGVDGMGRVSCTCRHLRDACADERLWVSLWEGPLPRGFLSGGRAAHVALWLLAKGAVEQTRVALCESVAAPIAGGGAHESRTVNRRRVGDLDASASVTGATGATGAGGGGGGGGGVGGAAGFPVHVSCMAISGGAMATAAGPEITVWDLGKVAPRARFRVGGHGSVTFLLFRNDTLLAGDNSGYLRSYDISVTGGSPLQQIRTHTDRVTAIDAFTFGVAGDDSAPSQDSSGKGGRPSRASGRDARIERHLDAAGRSSSNVVGGRQRRWDEGHGWGEGWEVEGGRHEASGTMWASARLGGEVGDLPQQGVLASLNGTVGAAGVGRGCGRGHGARLGGGSGGGGGIGPGGASGSGMVPGSSEPASLGKRQAYAGRGQGDYAPDSEARNHHIGAEIGQSESFSGAKEGARRDEEVGRAVLITGSDDGTAKAWDAASGRFVCMYAGHMRGVTCLQATSTKSYGPVLVTGGGDSSVIIWELATGRFLEKLETGAGLAANPDGLGPRVGCLQAFNDKIVVGEDRHVSVWTLSKGQRPRLERVRFCEHQRPIRRLDVVGRWIVTCSGDYVIRLWDSKTGQCVRKMGTKSGAAITSFRLSGLCLLTTSLFDPSVLMTRFLKPPPSPSAGSRAGQTKVAPRRSCHAADGIVAL